MLAYDSCRLEEVTGCVAQLLIIEYIMNWMENPYRHTGTDAEDLSYPPSGGRTKLLLLGILLPLAIGYFSVKAWVSGEVVWLGRGNFDTIVHGQTAKALAVAYFGVCLFCHFRWCWGLIPNYRVFEIGTIVSLLGFLGGLGYAFYTLFA